MAVAIAAAAVGIANYWRECAARGKRNREEAEEAKRKGRIFRATKGLITWNDWPRTIEGRAAAAAAKRADQRASQRAAQRAAMIALDAANAAGVAALAAEEAAKKDAVQVAEIIATEKVMSVAEQIAAAFAAAEEEGKVIDLT